MHLKNTRRSMSTKFALHPCDIGNSIKTVQKLRGAGIYCDSFLLDAKMCIRLKKIMKFQKGKQKWIVGEFICCTAEGENFI